MRLLLLGCTGFVGKELLPTLINENHEIYIVSRKPISKLKLDLDFNNFKFLQIDLSKEKNWNNENRTSSLKLSSFYWWCFWAMVVLLFFWDNRCPVPSCSNGWARNE